MNENNDPSLITWLAFVVSFFAVAFTVWRTWRDIRVQNSLEYLTASNRQLERAYEMFYDACSAEWDGLPKPDRLLWFTVARRIIESDDTSKMITERSHITLCNNSRNFFRGKFQDLLKPLGTTKLNYFADSADTILIQSGDDRDPISPKTLRVILDFMKWPEGMPNPITEVEEFTQNEIDRLQSFRPSVGDYLDAINVMKSNNEERKNYYRSKWEK